MKVSRLQIYVWIIDWLDEKIVTSRLAKFYEFLEDLVYLMPNGLWGE